MDDVVTLAKSQFQYSPTLAIAGIRSLLGSAKRKGHILERRAHLGSVPQFMFYVQVLRPMKPFAVTELPDPYTILGAYPMKLHLEHRITIPGSLTDVRMLTSSLGLSFIPVVDATDRLREMAELMSAGDVQSIEIGANAGRFHFFRQGNEFGAGAP